MFRVIFCPSSGA